MVAQQFQSSEHCIAAPGSNPFGVTPLWLGASRVTAPLFGRGQRVERGDLIGTVGDSGLSAAPHLHYEVRLDDEPVNPINYFFLELTPEEYDRLILISLLSGQSFD